MMRCTEASLMPVPVNSCWLCKRWNAPKSLLVSAGWRCGWNASANGKRSAELYHFSDSPQAAEPIRADPAVQPIFRESNLLEVLAFPRSNTEFWGMIARIKRSAVPPASAEGGRMGGNDGSVSYLAD
jgi:hypothetical protein